MKLSFKCVDCGCILGIYEGAEFFLTFPRPYQRKMPVKVVCKKCWKKSRRKRVWRIA